MCIGSLEPKKARYWDGISSHDMNDWRMSGAAAYEWANGAVHVIPVVQIVVTVVVV